MFTPGVTWGTLANGKATIVERITLKREKGYPRRNRDIVGETFKTSKIFIEI